MFKLALEKAEEPEIKLPTSNIHWIIEKAREFQKNIYFCFIDDAKAFDCVDIVSLGIIFNPSVSLLPHLHTDFSRDRSGGLVYPSLSEFSTVFCDPHSQDTEYSDKKEKQGWK